MSIWRLNILFFFVLLIACRGAEPDILNIPDVDNDNKGEYLNGIGPEAYPDVPISDIYEVTITRKNHKEKVIVFQNACPEFELGYMDMVPNDVYPLEIFKNRTINWINFSFENEVKVEVKVISEKVSVAGLPIEIFPSRHNIQATTNGNTIVFTLTRHGQYSLEIGSNGYKNGLIIFANPKETDSPNYSSTNTAVLKKASKEDVLYLPTSTREICFEEGVHDIGVYSVPLSVKSIYLKDGAWVYGSFILNGNPDVKIFGRGVLSSGRLKYRESHCIEAINGSENIHLEGIVVADPKYYAVRLIGKNNTVKWIKVIGGWTYNCDGIAAFEGSKVSNCFIWANDDAIKIYRNNITWSDCVVWQLNNGGIIQMSWGGSNASNVRVSRIDVLRAEWNKPGFNRALLNCVGNHYQTAGLFGVQENWIIEDVITETPIPIVFNISPNGFTPNLIRNLTLKNWNVQMQMNMNYENTILANIPENSGYTSVNYFSGFIFDNVVFNNVKLTESNWLSVTKMNVENFTDITFK